jgi:hypothetical protein
MKQWKRTIQLGLWALLLWTGAAAQALTIVTNRYDIEPSGGVTESGWTHIDPSVGYTTTSAGFDLTQTFSYGAFDRGSSAQTPTSVTRDFILGNGRASATTPTVVFRDIVPEHATNVSFTIYRSDPADSFGAAFTTKASVNGGPLVTIHTGGGGVYPYTYYSPITGNLALPALTNATTLDFYFFDAGALGSSEIRLNGIEAIYTIPEPATMSLAALAAVVWLRRRR